MREKADLELSRLNITDVTRHDLKGNIAETALL